MVLDDIYLLFGVDVCPDGRMYLGSLGTIVRVGRARLQGYPEGQKNCLVVAGGGGSPDGDDWRMVVEEGGW